MTMQIKDSLYYTDKSYTIVTCNTPLCFDPREYGVTPTPYTTACHRGHWSEYSILNDQLVLQNLFIYTNSNDYPPIANIESVPAHRSHISLAGTACIMASSFQFSTLGKFLLAVTRQPRITSKEFSTIPGDLKTL